MSIFFIQFFWVQKDTLSKIDFFAPLLLPLAADPFHIQKIVSRFYFSFAAILSLFLNRFFYSPAPGAILTPL